MGTYAIAYYNKHNVVNSFSASPNKTFCFPGRAAQRVQFFKPGI